MCISDQLMPVHTVNYEHSLWHETAKLKSLSRGKNLIHDAIVYAHSNFNVYYLSESFALESSEWNASNGKIEIPA